MKSSLPKQRRTRLLRAKASVINPSEFEDYGPEPNMKLSHAFMVVLALHIVAVGGLFAFNKVKASRTPVSLKSKAEHLFQQESVASAQPSSKPLESLPGSTKTITAHEHTEASVSPNILKSTPQLLQTPVQALIQTTSSQNIPGATQNLPPPPATPSSSLPIATSTPKDSTDGSSQEVLRDYTIVKGDNPYKLAKKFHVSYDALMKLNNITDARKIQISQKLKIPASSTIIAQKTTTAKSAQKKKIHR